MEELYSYLGRYKKVAIAFSGGVDSAYLVYAAKEAGCEVYAYFVKSPFQPEFELADAKELADSLGFHFTVERLDVLSVSEVAKNPKNRCYYCKKAIFTRILSLAEKDGCEVVFDGTNASDSADDRPGMKAIKELGVLSPLRICGLTKEEIRRRSKLAGLFTWDKPAYACLATRVPAGTEITAEMLTKIEKAEEALFQLGFSDFRVRLLPQGAKLQFPEAQFAKLLEQREAVLKALSPLFDNVLLDLVPR